MPAAAAYAADNRDACAILEKADVEAAFSPLKFDSGKPGIIVKSANTIADVSRCTYISSGTTAKDMVTVSLLARRAPTDETGTTPEAARAGAIKLKAKPVEVAGLGKGAYWVNLGSKSLPMIQLNVFRGKREWLIFSSGAKSMDTKSLLDRLTKTAKAASARQ